MGVKGWIRGRRSTRGNLSSDGLAAGRDGNGDGMGGAVGAESDIHEVCCSGEMDHEEFVVPEKAG